MRKYSILAVMLATFLNCNPQQKLELQEPDSIPAWNMEGDHLTTEVDSCLSQFSISVWPEKKDYLIFEEYDTLNLIITLNEQGFDSIGVSEKSFNVLFIDSLYKVIYLYHNGERTKLK